MSSTVSLLGRMWGFQPVSFLLQTLKSAEVQEQWLTDLHYCFNIYLATHPPGPGAISTEY